MIGIPTKKTPIIVSMNEILEKKIKMLPTDPGVYVMLNGDGHVIYVGKAKVLKNRVKQYFYSNVKTDKVMAMVSNIEDFYYIITKSEVDALSLENNLIKKYKPKYNILLKDDKTYPYIKINLKKSYPYFEIVRKIKRDGAKYFGPFMGVSAKDILDIVNDCYMIRSCRIPLEKHREKRECLDYHIKRCPAPCTGRITEKEYLVNVDKAIDFLSGNDDEAEDILIGKMERYAQLNEYELAISVRDKLKILDKIKQKKITNLNRFINADVIAVASNGLYFSVNVLLTRSGRMQGGKNFYLNTLCEEKSEALFEFIKSYYTIEESLPDEIILSEECAEIDLLEDFFKKEYNKSVSILVPKQGVRRQLVEMALSNANDYLDKTVSKIIHDRDLTVNACKKLQIALNLKRYPKRMECYDISNISGVDKVASMVVFTDGEKDAKEYRRFMIKTVEGANDFASLKETLQRRLAKLGTSEEERFPKPDLIIIDGGKGQLSSVKEIFDELGVTDIDLISLAKREEEVYTIFSNEPVIIQHSDYALRLLQRIRDEAHRFAITYFRSKHLKRNLESVLDKIPGIGKKYKDALMDAFKTVEAIKEADIDTLESVSGIGNKRAKTIYDYLRSEKNGNC